VSAWQARYLALRFGAAKQLDAADGDDAEEEEDLAAGYCPDCKAELKCLCGWSGSGMKKESVPPILAARLAKLARIDAYAADVRKKAP
jgi:hypothetical protein